MFHFVSNEAGISAHGFFRQQQRSSLSRLRVERTIFLCLEQTEQLIHDSYLLNCLIYIYLRHEAEQIIFRIIFYFAD